MSSFAAAKYASSVNVALPWGATEEIYGSRAGCISALNVARPTGYAEPTEELNMFILAPVLMLTAAPAPNANWNCDEPEVQQEMNWCAHQDFLVADAELNTQWRLNSAILKERDIQWMDGHGNADDGKPGFFETMLSAQRAWLAYRDAHCRSEGYSARGGSLEPLLVSSCKAELTRKRTAELAKLIASA